MSHLWNYTLGFQDEPDTVASRTSLTCLWYPAFLAPMSNHEQGNVLGLRIKRARERKGWTQTQLAQAVGVKSARTVGGWERGEHVPMNRLGKLEEVLGPGINPANEVKVSAGASVKPEIRLMFAHFDELSQMDLLRLSRLIQDVALGGEG